MIKNITKGGILLAAIATVGLATQAFAYNQITTQLDPGARGQNVTNLQTFFADNASIYPEGMITGYFGTLTKNSVNRFQAAYGLSQVGRVGPATMAKINSLIGGGGWNGTTPTPSGDVYAPVVSNMSQNSSSNAATLSWSTNENATGKVFYGTRPITIDEGNVYSVGFDLTTGYVATNNNIAASSQQVNIGGLLSNTTYYYIIVSTDTAGNVTVYNVNNTFRTN